jgi:phenylacetate-CoA ligase
MRTGKERLEALLAKQPLRLAKGLASALIAYPLAERMEKRVVRPKLSELRNHYLTPFAQRIQLAKDRLTDTLAYAQYHVPYYRDLFSQLAFNPENVRNDVSYMQDLPFLTKDIIREQGERLHSKPIQETRHYACKTGGSTGLSCVVYYDQVAADYSSAVTIYARERIGKTKHKNELHFACQFPDAVNPKWPNREDLKCFAMNRSNVFFSRLDDAGLEEIWRILRQRLPYLVHTHPSTIYALACYIERKYGGGKAFQIFESSGELLEPYQRKKIESALQCRVVNRYGLAEFGVIGYELNGLAGGLQLLESEGWPECRPTDGADNGAHELVFTGFRNKLMPLIRYCTGDLSQVQQQATGFFMANVVGRMHDLVPINGIPHPTHYIMDMLDHRVGGIQEFQIDLRNIKPTLRIVPEAHASLEQIQTKISEFWGQEFDVKFVGTDELVRVGHHQKFRHLIHS